MVFIESRAFSKAVEDVLSDEELAELQSKLAANPKRGDPIPGTGGLRKTRASQSGRGKGKRGGARVLYLHLEDRDHIHLLFIFGKDEQADLTPDQKKVLKKLVTSIKKT